MADHASVIAFLREIDALKGVERRSYIADKTRLENSAEHSWHMAMAAWLLAKDSGEDLDLERVLKMALAHDLCEIDAGDTYIYAASQEGKRAAEEACVERLTGQDPALLGELADLWREYEDQTTRESRWVKAADRILPFMLSMATEGGCWRENGIAKSQVLEANRPIADVSPALYDWVRAQVDVAVEQGWLVDA